MKHRSINQRLKRAKSNETKQEILQDWAENWQQEQLHLIKMIENAISSDDYNQLCTATSQLKAMSSKRFAALPKIFNNVMTKNQDE